jgi:hypothetical protein
LICGLATCDHKNATTASITATPLNVRTGANRSHLHAKIPRRTDLLITPRSYPIVVDGVQIVSIARDPRTEI